MASGDFVYGGLHPTNNPSYTPPSGAKVLIFYLNVQDGTQFSVTAGDTPVANVNTPPVTRFVIDSTTPLRMSGTSNSRRVYYSGVEL